MTADRSPFWNPEKRVAYLKGVAAKSDEIRRLRDGEETAKRLPKLWAELEEQEKQLLLALLLLERKSFIAKHDLPLLRNLIEKARPGCCRKSWSGFRFRTMECAARQLHRRSWLRRERAAACCLIMTPATPRRN